MPLAALGSIGGGLIGAAASSGDREAQQQAIKQALANIQNVNTPTADQLKIALQQYQSAGQLAPQTEQTINQGNSQMANIATDPRLAQAQMGALASLQAQGMGGLTAQDKASLAQVQNQTAQQANGRDQSILQNMQARGQGGAGAELAARLSNSQGAANTANQAGLNIAGQSNANALQAIMNAGNLGSSMQNQSFNQQAQQAQAQDVINRYNAMNQQTTANQNTGLQNYAQQYNLANNQNLSNQNTGLANQQQVYNQNVNQQVYNDQMQKAQALANPTYAVAKNAGESADRTAAQWQNIGSGAGQMGSAAMMMSNGGVVHHMDAGGPVMDGSSGESGVEYQLHNQKGGGDSGSGGGMSSMMSMLPMLAMLSKGGPVPESYSKFAGLSEKLRSNGGKVPGKAPVKGDSPENDIIPTMLSPGEIVLPRTVANDIHKVSKFIKAIHEYHKVDKE